MFAGSDGICVNQDCTNLATEIDHIEGRGRGDIESNLQGLCHSCHLEKSLRYAGFLSDEMIRERKKVMDSGLLADFFQTYAARALSLVPRLVCDDAELWPTAFRQIMKTRRVLKKDLHAKAEVARMKAIKESIARELATGKAKSEIAREQVNSGVTQAEVARRLDVSRKSVWKWVHRQQLERR